MDFFLVIKIVSIYLQFESKKQPQNLEKLVQPITAFDQIISNNVTFDNQLPNYSSHSFLISLLFEYCLNPIGFIPKIIGNTYILETFQCFVNNKQSIGIDTYALNGYCKNIDLLGLLFNKIIKNKEVEDKQQNLIKKGVLKVFKNVTDLFIYCPGYSFCLLSFLSVIDGTEINKVEIEGYEWIRSIASSSSFDSICTQYQKANFEITLTDDKYEIYINKTVS